MNETTKPQGSAAENGQGAGAPAEQAATEAAQTLPLDPASTQAWAAPGPDANPGAQAAPLANQAPVAPGVAAAPGALASQPPAAPVAPGPGYVAPGPGATPPAPATPPLVAYPHGNGFLVVPVGTVPAQSWWTKKRIAWAAAIAALALVVTAGATAWITTAVVGNDGPPGVSGSRMPGSGSDGGSQGNGRGGPGGFNFGSGSGQSQSGQGDSAQGQGDAADQGSSSSQSSYRAGV
ncbi:hypothetical protein [Rarobacter incanus]|uniref:Uncharacterized protein n=1 Tax=Rarobacter incanus TaxID=153494 RepID=A0A542SQU4_9MICO|nr:hypothetical protein [Rarobacter incanus]TQK76989.1 hypothetical protein FB389_1697 [Rarobacter incanus]